MLKELESRLEKEGSLERAQLSQRFFKTGRGEYGAGDIFLGITMPRQREIARDFLNLSMRELQKLLDSKIHEKRMISLLILADKYKKGDSREKRRVFDFYLQNVKKVNNWDLVDLSSYKILGEFLIDKDREVLHRLAISNNLWERRIATISCFAFIRKSDFSDALRISETLLRDKHDLIHKAVGWMLREIGKKDKSALISFLNKNYKIMPRTMLRYAIERLDEETRREYMRR